MYACTSPAGRKRAKRSAVAIGLSALVFLVLAGPAQASDESAIPGLNDPCVAVSAPIAENPVDESTSDCSGQTDAPDVPFFVPPEPIVLDEPMLELASVRVPSDFMSFPE